MDIIRYIHIQVYSHLLRYTLLCPKPYTDLNNILFREQQKVLNLNFHNLNEGKLEKMKKMIFRHKKS